MKALLLGPISYFLDLWIVKMISTSMQLKIIIDGQNLLGIKRLFLQNITEFNMFFFLLTFNLYFLVFFVTKGRSFASLYFDRTHGELKDEISKRILWSYLYTFDVLSFGYLEKVPSINRYFFEQRDKENSQDKFFQEAA